MPNKPSKFWQDKSTNCFIKVDIIRCVRLILFIFLFSIADQSFAQNSQIDSLKAVLPTIEEDTSRVKLFIELGNKYRFLEIDSSYVYFKKAVELAEKINAKGFMADALIDVGINHQIQGTYDSTLHFFQKSLEVATEMGDRKRIEIYYAQNAGLYHDMGLYDSAVANYFRCLTMAKERGTESGQAWLYNRIGVVYYEQGLYDEAVRYYLLALDIREKQGDRWQMTVGYNNIGEIYRLQEMPDKALEYFKKALSIHEEAKPYEDREQGSSLATTYNNIGEIYYSRDSIDQAKNYYLKALRIFEELGLKRRMAESTQLLGDIHLIQGNYMQAREYYSSAREFYQESGDKMGLADIYVEMANLEITVADSSAQSEAQRIGYYEEALQIASRSYAMAREMDLLPTVNGAANALMRSYNKLGDHKNGMKWAMIFIETQDSMYREDKIRAIQDMNTKYETEKKQQQIELQESQLVAKDAQIKQQKTYRNALAAGFFAVILIIIVIVYAYIQKRKDNKKIKTQHDEIEAQRDEIEAQRDEVVSTNKALEKRKRELESTLENLKLAQSQLIQSEKMASVGILTAGIAHELNNPINFVSGNVNPLIRDVNDLFNIINKYEEIVKANKFDGPFGEVVKLKASLGYSFLIKEIISLLEGIEDGANRSSQIVKGMRSFSRLDEEESQLYNIHEGIDSALILLHNKIKNRIKIRKEYGDLKEIDCFPSKLNQVILNILNNSIQAIDDKGEIFIKTVSGGIGAKIFVKDSGKGMTPEVKKHIFDPFYTTKDVGKGIGLGLSISYGIIEQHNGKIDVISEPGKGTEFIISLPKTQPD